MKFLAAYLLANLNTEQEVSAKSLTTILTAAGIDADKEKIKTIIDSLKGKDINEIIAEGSAKLATVGGGSGAASSGAAKSSGGKAAEVVEEAPAEDAESEDDDMGFGLFD
jgi:large subunit ribosomal protein LP2